MESLRLFNVKSFEDSGEIELKPITILVGKNSCGKSSLLRFPAVLKQTAIYGGLNPPVSFFGDTIDYGNYEDIVYRKDTSQKISFSLAYSFDISGNTRIFTDDATMVIGHRDKKTDVRKVTLTVTLSRNDKQVEVDRVELCIDNTPISCLTRNDNEEGYSLLLEGYYEKYNLVGINVNLHFNYDEVMFDKFFPIYEGSEEVVQSIAKTIGLVIKNEQELEEIVHLCLRRKLYNPREQLFPKKDYSEIITIYYAFVYSHSIMTLFHRLFVSEFSNRVAYIGPFRIVPERIYRDSESSKKDVGVRGENVSDILIYNSHSHGMSIVSKVSDLLKKYFGYTLSVEELENQYYQIILTDAHSVKSNITDVGFGISQVLPIIMQICLSAEKAKSGKTPMINDILLIEQPELHLHPAAQACLADLFEMCVSYNPQAKLIIETHSEHLISKLQVLIADPDCHLDNSMVQILYVDKDEDGSSYINNIGIKENGKFEKEWPEDFFDQGYKLSLQLMRKSAARKKVVIMDKVTIVLSCEALYSAVTDPINSSTAIERIKQHNILFTEKILKQYELYFKKHDLIDVFQEWYKNIQKLDIIQLVDELDEDVYTDIKFQFQKYRFPIYIKTNSETSVPCVKYIEKYENVNTRDVDCRFNRYCIPATFTIKENENFADFRNWLSFMSNGENIIVIIDPYIFEGLHPELFEILYLPIFIECPQLEIIYSEKNKPEKSTISSLKKQCPSIKVTSKPKNKLHDRHLCSKSWNISIGYGLRVFDESTKKSIAETQVTLSPPTSNPTISGLIPHK